MAIFIYLKMKTKCVNLWIWHPIPFISSIFNTASKRKITVEFTTALMLSNIYIEYFCCILIFFQFLTHNSYREGCVTTSSNLAATEHNSHCEGCVQPLEFKNKNAAMPQEKQNNKTWTKENVCSKGEIKST